MTDDFPLLHLDNLQFRWRPDRPCLDIAHFAVATGERVFLHGESGSGKSTLLGLLGGVLLAQQGSLRFLGEDLASLPAGRRDQRRADHIGFIFQQFNLIPYLPALDNVLLPCRFSRRRLARTRDAGGEVAEARRLLGHLDIGPDLWRRPALELSVGQQQRVAVARALIGRPELVIADEPTSSLDAPRQTAFLDLLLAECDASGAALIFVSHDPRLASHFQRCVGLAELQRQPVLAA